MHKVVLVDGTLREGEQSPGVFFTREEKTEIARELDRIGVPILDVGMPSISPEERESISSIADLGLRASVGVSVRLKTQEVEQAMDCGADEIFLICPVSPVHMHSKLGMDGTEVAKLAGDVVAFAESRGLIVNLVAEDAARGQVPFMGELLSMAYNMGARRAFICDTVGVMEPFGMKSLVGSLREAVPDKMELGAHCHDDLGLATANTLAAIEAGANFPSVTVNGIGERAGNAPLHEVAVGIEKLLLREHGIDIHNLYELSRLVERYSGVFISPHTPIVGHNAFRHESGIHVDGLLKDGRTYTGLSPQEVNRTSSFVLGKHAGTGTILHLLKKRGYKAGDEELSMILKEVKEWKAQKGKGEIRRMAERIEKFYADSLDFPEENFWEIVEGVLGSNA